MATKRVLVCLLAGLGDALMASPMIESIKRQRPDWEVHTISAMRATGEYAEMMPCVDSAECEDFLDYNIFLKAKKLGRLAHRRYDYVILPYPAGRWQYHAGALVASRGRLIAHRYRKLQSLVPGYAWGEPLEPIHVVDLNARLLRGLGLEPLVERRYSCPPAWKSLPEGRRRRVAFHLTSLDSAINKGNHHKAWPMENYCALGQRLTELGFEVAAVGVGKELAVIESFRAMCDFPVATISGSLNETAQQLASCSAVVSHESGIAHLAAATGVPTVCIFAMTDPKRFAPVGNVSIVRGSDCKPCYDPKDKSFGCKLNSDFRCIKLDSPVSHVEAVLREMLPEIGLSVPAFATPATV